MILDALLLFPYQLLNNPPRLHLASVCGHRCRGRQGNNPDGLGYLAVVLKETHRSTCSVEDDCVNGGVFIQETLYIVAS